MAKFGFGNSNMAFTFEIDNIFINYSYNVDTMSLWCQTKSKYSKIW